MRTYVCNRGVYKGQIASASKREWSGNKPENDTSNPIRNIKARRKKKKSCQWNFLVHLRFSLDARTGLITNVEFELDRPKSGWEKKKGRLLDRGVACLRVAPRLDLGEE